MRWAYVLLGAVFVSAAQLSSGVAQSKSTTIECKGFYDFNSGRPSIELRRLFEISEDRNKIDWLDEGSDELVTSFIASDKEFTFVTIMKLAPGWSTSHYRWRINRYTLSAIIETLKSTQDNPSLPVFSKDPKNTWSYKVTNTNTIKCYLADKQKI